MDDDVMKKIEERIQSLPKDIQESILASEFEDRIAKIGQANRLHLDQIGDLGDETTLVMLGFAPLDGFAEHLQKKLHLYSEQATAIAAAVNSEVFLPIRESIKKFQVGQGTKAATPTSPAIKTPPSTSTPPAPKDVVQQKPAANSPKINFNIPQSGQATAQKPPSAPAAMESADIMLSHKTVSIPVQKPSAAPATTTVPTAPPASEPKASSSAPKVKELYKTDPYREPVE